MGKLETINYKTHCISKNLVIWTLFPTTFCHNNVELQGVGKIVQGILLLRGILGERKNHEFQNRKFQGLAIGLVFQCKKPFKVNIWHLSINKKRKKQFFAVKLAINMVFKNSSLEFCGDFWVLKTENYQNPQISRQRI